MIFSINLSNVIATLKVSQHDFLWYESRSFCYNGCSHCLLWNHETICRVCFGRVCWSSIRCGCIYLKVIFIWHVFFLPVRIINNGPATSTQWLCDTPVHSDVEGKLRMLLTDLGNAGKILGIQVRCFMFSDIWLNLNCGVSAFIDYMFPLVYNMKYARS